MKRKKIIKKLWTAHDVSASRMADADADDAYEPVLCGGSASAAYYDGYNDGIYDAAALLEWGREIVIPGSDR